MFAGTASADIIIDEALLKKIDLELKQSEDFSIFDKYIFPGTKILLDLYPDDDRGLTEMSYEKFREFSKLGFELMENFEQQTLSFTITIDTENNQGVTEEKSISVADMLGYRTEDEAITKITYGVLDGKVKILVFEETTISSTTEEIDEN